MRLAFMLFAALLVQFAEAKPTATNKQPLVIAYGGYAEEPYVFMHNNQVSGGVYWDLAELISERLARPVIFRRVPRKRIEQYLASGKAHVMLLGHPTWVQKPEALEWTSTLIREYNQLVQAKGRTFTVNSLDDLVGKRIGMILGYHYRGLSDEPYRSTVVRDDAKDVEANFKRLAQGRLDALLDSNILIAYFLQQHQAHDRFEVVTSWNIPYDTVSGISPKSPVSAAKLSEVYQQLHREGKIDAMLERYLNAPTPRLVDKKTAP